MTNVDADTNLPAKPTARALTTTHDAVPILDTGKFEHMQRVAVLMADSPLTPKHLRVESDLRQTVANCFRVVNQAVRWGFDPFSMIDETYCVAGKLGYSGKLIAAVVNAKAGLQERLSYSYNEKPGDDLTITVTGTFMGESTPRTVTVAVGAVKTDHKMWKSDPRQKLIYTGATKWARAHCPELLLGVITDDDIERMQAMGTLAPQPDGTYAPQGVCSSYVRRPYTEDICNTCAHPERAHQPSPNAKPGRPRALQAALDAAKSEPEKVTEAVVGAGDQRDII